MINPSDLPTHTAPSAHLAQIEEHIDREIQQHAASGRHWPLSLRTTRSGWTISEIEEVLVKYRAAGWIALTPGNGLMAVLSPLPASASTATEPAPSGTAYHTLTTIAGLVETDFLPPGRATATATTIREMASIGDRLPLTLDDARAGYGTIAIGGDPGNEPSNVAGRRKTCGEIAALILAESVRLGHDYAIGQPHRLGDVLAAVAERYAGAARQAAICETSKREALELAAGARPMDLSPDEAAVLGAARHPTCRNCGAVHPGTQPCVGETVDQMIHRLCGGWGSD